MSSSQGCQTWYYCTRFGTFDPQQYIWYAATKFDENLVLFDNFPIFRLFLLLSRQFDSLLRNFFK